VKTLEQEIRIIDKTECWVISIGIAVFVVSALFLIYAAIVSF